MEGTSANIRIIDRTGHKLLGFKKEDENIIEKTRIERVNFVKI